MHAYLDTAGERLAIECSLPWAMELIAEGASGELRESEAVGAALTMRVEADRQPFDTRGWDLLARGAWLRAGARPATTLASGMDQLSGGYSSRSGSRAGTDAGCRMGARRSRCTTASRRSCLTA
jgi:hypothetical protein